MKMMKSVALTVAVVAAMATGAMAQSLSQQVGVSALYQNSSDFDDGWGAGLKYTLLVNDVAPKLALGADVRCGWLTYSDTDVYPLELTVLARYEVVSGARPYVGGGVGYYFFDESGSISIDDDFGYYAVVGWDQSLTKNVLVFAEAKYLWLTPDTNMKDDDFSGVGANIGVAYNW